MNNIYFILVAIFIWGCASRIPDGVNPIYYPNGTLKAEVTYKKNKKTGLAKEYYENGKLKSEYNYLEDILHGPMKQYYNIERNILLKKMNYEAGLKQGPSVEYYPDGKRK